MADRALKDFNFLDPEVQKNPIGFYDAMRREEPVYREPATGAWFLTKAEDIRWAADHPELFSNVIDPSVFRVCQGGKLLEEKDPEVASIFKERGWVEPFTLLLNDPPVQARYRSIASAALGPEPVKKLEPFIQRQADAIIARLPGDGEIEFMHDFADKLPLSIIGHLFGAPEGDLAQIKAWSEQFFSTEIGQGTREDYLRTVDCMIEMQHYVVAKVEAQRKEPKDNFLQAIMDIHKEIDCEPMSIEEILSFCHVILVAGHDSTSQTLGNCFRVIAEFPEIAERLRTEPEKVDDFIAEILRLYSPARFTPRRTTRKVTVRGVTIPRDSTVFMAWQSANMDEDEYQCPHQLDINREEKKHFSFGRGIHFCVGSRLARTTIRTAIVTLLREFRVIGLAVKSGELEYIPAANICMLKSLPLHVAR